MVSRAGVALKPITKMGVFSRRSVATPRKKVISSDCG